MLSLKSPTSTLRQAVRRCLAAAACLLPGAVAPVVVAQQTISSMGAPKAQKQEFVIGPSWAWRATTPAGLTVPARIDTVFTDYSLQFIPSMQYSRLASAITGNYGAEGMTMIYSERQPMGEFFFADALRPYIPYASDQIFYNTRRPMTLLSYAMGGGREQAQDRLKAVFSGNVNSRAQVGAHLDYIYSKGSYAQQAMKNLAWGVNGSYMGDRYQMQAAFNQFNSLNKENGGIVDDLYITDPAEIQGGAGNVDTKNIPTNLTNAHTRLRGEDARMIHKYRLGSYHTVEVPPPAHVEPGSEADTVSHASVFVPVSSVTWTARFRNFYHMFRDDAPDDELFWQNTYFTPGTTHDETKYWALDNTVALSLEEGFNRRAHFGLTAFIHHQVARYTQAPDTLERTPGLTPYPLATPIAPRTTEQRLYVGAQLAKRQGAIIRYDATAEIGVAGAAAGELRLSGNVATRFRLRSDSVDIRAFGSFTNDKAPLFTRSFVSNHFIWSNDFGKTRRVRFGGELTIPHSSTALRVQVDNVQNLIYFGPDAMPLQHTPNVQVFSARLSQQLRLGILHWDNDLCYQKSSDTHVLPMPEFSIYSNLYILFRVATLHVQLGVDCNYTTLYQAMAYQPANMSFHTQGQGIRVGNYPLCNAYVNMKLSKVRIFVLFSHVNQGLFGGAGYFSAAHYPLNPRRLEMGLSIDFAN